MEPGKSTIAAPTIFIASMSALPRIFISAASREFNTPEFPYRDQLHRVLRRGHRRQVRVQEDQNS